MSLHYQFRPLVVWPGKATLVPRASNFSTPYGQTLALLERELKCLAARNVVLQAFVAEQQIRRDGMLYAQAQPTRPGVILAFDSKHGPLAYPCDTFRHWQDNVRAIALALEALRAVDRYGVTKRAEQYHGWQALPNPEAEPPAIDAAREVIREVVGAAKFAARGIDEAIRDALMKTHPDRGGDAEAFNRVMAAKQVIESRG